MNKDLKIFLLTCFVLVSIYKISDITIPKYELNKDNSILFVLNKRTGEIKPIEIYKFYYIFEDVRQQKQDFVQRFADMYGYLKQDKSSINVARQHRGKTLPGLAGCDPIGDYIVCDQSGSNWVFQRRF